MAQQIVAEQAVTDRASHRLSDIAGDVVSELPQFGHLLGGKGLVWPRSRHPKEAPSDDRMGPWARPPAWLHWAASLLTTSNRVVVGAATRAPGTPSGPAPLVAAPRSGESGQAGGDRPEPPRPPCGLRRSGPAC